MQIGMMFGNPETTPGGKALKFAASVRLDVRRIAQVKKGEETVGSRVRVKVVKNKVAPPFKVAEFDIMYGDGISYEGDVLNAGIAAGIVSKSGASYAFAGTRIGTGFDNVRIALKENRALLKQIEKAIEAGK
jgi:recombination protein RecA